MPTKSSPEFLSPSKSPARAPSPFPGLEVDEDMDIPANMAMPAVAGLSGGINRVVDSYSDGMSNAAARATAVPMAAARPMNRRSCQSNRILARTCCGFMPSPDLDPRGISTGAGSNSTCTFFEAWIIGILKLSTCTYQRTNASDAVTANGDAQLARSRIRKTLLHWIVGWAPAPESASAHTAGCQ